MKILVTGGAGYIGSVMVPELLDAGHFVTVLDSFLYNQTSLLSHCHYKNLKIVRGDVRDKAVVSELTKENDAVFPLACMTGAPACDRDATAAESVNLNAVRMIAGLVSKSQRIIFPTTNSGYGVGENGIYCTEETPLRPVSLYGRLKADAEKALLDGGNAVVFRLATAFGASPRMRLDLLVNDFTYRAVTDRFVVLFEAHFKRNYVHVRDIAGAFLFGLENFDRLKGSTYNLGLSNANLDKRELCEEIKKKLPEFYFTEAPVGKDPDSRNYIVSNEKIEKAGFSARVTIGEGIDELIKAYTIIRRNQFSNL